MFRVLFIILLLVFCVPVQATAPVAIDYELSSKKLPDWVREVARRDPEFAAMLVGGAYNGGPPQAERLAELVEGFKREHGLDLEDLTVEHFPAEAFKRLLDGPRVGLKPETRLYIKKIIDNWRHLRLHGPRVYLDNIEGELS